MLHNIAKRVWGGLKGAGQGNLSWHMIGQSLYQPQCGTTASRGYGRFSPQAKHKATQTSETLWGCRVKNQTYQTDQGGFRIHESRQTWWISPSFISLWLCVSLMRRYKAREAMCAKAFMRSHVQGWWARQTFIVNVSGKHSHQSGFWGKKVCIRSHGSVLSIP